MNKTALLTGASKRIGKSIAEFLAEIGWNIIIHYNYSESDAVLLVGDLSVKYPDQTFGIIKTDLADKGELAKLIPSAISKFGEFQLLINNASVFNSGYIRETSFELFESQMRVNFKAPFILVRDFENYCKKGNIINIVDTRVTSNKSNFAAYSLSKKNLWELTKMAALEFAPEIRVNAIAPGVTLPPENEDDKYLEDLAKEIPMKTTTGLAPLLNSIQYILENKQLTGQILFADGGENLGSNT